MVAIAEPSRLPLPSVMAAPTVGPEPCATPPRLGAEPAGEGSHPVQPPGLDLPVKMPVETPVAR
jgi:hypothetical protein